MEDPNNADAAQGTDAAAGNAAAAQAPAASASTAKKKAPIANGVQSMPKDMSAGVEVFPGVSAVEHNKRQQQRRDRNREDFQ